MDEKTKLELLFIEYDVLYEEYQKAHQEYLELPQCCFTKGHHIHCPNWQ